MRAVKVFAADFFRLFYFPFKTEPLFPLAPGNSSAMQCVNTARSQGSLPVCASALNGAARAPHGLYPARVHKADASVRCSKEKHANDQEAKKIVQHPAPIAALRGAAGGLATCGAAQRIDATLAGAVSAATSKSGYFFSFIGATATPAVGACTGFKTYTIVASWQQ